MGCLSYRKIKRLPEKRERRRARESLRIGNLELEVNGNNNIFPKPVQQNISLSEVPQHTDKVDGEYDGDGAYPIVFPAALTELGEHTDGVMASLCSEDELPIYGMKDVGMPYDFRLTQSDVLSRMGMHITRNKYNNSNGEF